MGTHDKNLTLPRLMSQLDLADVEDFAEIYGFESQQWKGNKDAGKAKRWLANQILCHPVEVLNKLPISDLMMIEQIIKNDSGMEAFTSHTSTYGCALGLIDFHTDGEYDYFDMPPELVKAFAPHIEEAINDVKNQVRFVAENELIGMTNLYGMVTRGEYLKQLEKDLAFDAGGNVHEFYVWLRENSVWIHFDDWGDEDDDNEVVFYSPFMWDDIDKFENHVKRNIRRKHFSRDVIKDAGKFPTPGVSNPYSGKMRHMLKQDFKLEGDEIDYIMFEIWWRLQHEEDADFEDSYCKDYILHELMPTAKPERGGADVLVRMLQTFIDYCNSTPRWTLRGHCPSDM